MTALVLNLLRRASRRLSVRQLTSTGTMSSARSAVGSAKPNAKPIERVRNIGIMAHIDAGKTTSTERMLFYSGLIKHIGDIDDGDTTMDYMEQERNRGITIVSAAITFKWNKHIVNLIDTPGHVDFTYEVERALRILDGAVAIVDASAGVEAQTITVWKQADKYNIPRIAYHNKMDKLRANFTSSVNSMKEKLGANPLIIQLPIGQEKSFAGVIDLVTMEKVLWNEKDTLGTKYKRVKLSEAQDGAVFKEAMQYRELLLEQLADVDDDLAESVINSSDMLDIPSADVHRALRTATITRKGVPTLCGSSMKNKGVQPLMDAIVAYLPHPGEMRPKFLQYYNENCFCGLAFKIVHDKHHGSLTFVRIYSGTLTVGDMLYNANQSVSERISRILQIFADEHKEVTSASCGDIVALSGLRKSKTGDTLLSSEGDSKQAKLKMVELKRFSADSDEQSEAEDDDEDLVLAGVAPPDPVFFCAVEPPSLSEQRQLEMALSCLQREDPSLRVRVDEETMQIVLEGMGELHLDIVKDRILKEYGVDVYLGPLQIAYKETINKSGRASHTLKKTIGERTHEATLQVSVRPRPGSGVQRRIKFEVSRETVGFVHLISRAKLKAINRGLVSALSSGPLLRSPMVDVEVTLHEYVVPRSVPETMVAACASECVRRALADASAVLLEPTMDIQIETEERSAGAVLSDLSTRRSDILRLDADGTRRTIHALTPLSELVGYTTYLRTMTSGMATINMDLAEYRAMSQDEQESTIKKMTTFGMT